jgi:hypothetical protein
MTCHTLVHKLYREQLKTTKELLNMTTPHASGKDAVGATFIIRNMGMATDSGWAMPTRTTTKSTRKGAKGREKG